MSRPALRLHQGLASPPVRGQRGQALTEALVLSLLLVPLVLISILLGKYQAAQQAVVEAARSLAFECTVRIDECGHNDGFAKLAQEAVQRHLSRADREIVSLDQVPDLSRAPERHALFTNRRGDSLLSGFGDVALGVSPARFDAGLGMVRGLDASGRFTAAVNLISNLAGPARFGLDLHGGLLVGRVSADVGMQPGARAGADPWLDGWPLKLVGRTAILVDDWSASRPVGPEVQSVASRMATGARLAPAIEAAHDLAYAPTRAALALLGALGIEANASRFRYHDIDPDIVPADRLGPVAPSTPLPETYSGW